MSTEYLEINSAYRNRNQYPIPSDFVVEISQTGTKNRFTAVDPICESAPREIWRPQTIFSNASNFNGTIMNRIPPPLASATTNRTIIVVNIPRVAPFQASQVHNYYSGAVIEFSIGGGNYEYERILEWRYLYTNSTPPPPGSPPEDVFLVTLYNQVSNNAIQNNTPINIKDPTDFTDTNNLVMYIPNSVPSNNYYIDYYIFNQTKNEWLDISYYNGATHLAKLSTTNLTLYLGNWLPSDTYILRKQIPSEIQTPLTPTISPFVYQLVPSSSSIDKFYVGSYLRVQNSSTESRRIINYIPVPPPGAVPPFNVPNLVVLETPFSFAVLPPPPGVSYEILPFTRDNECPFEYSGSLVSHREAVCYDIELLNLVLPNTTLSTGYGSRAVFYPFVYVQLTAINNSEGQGPNMIASNNPNSRRMLFRALVFDTTNEVNTPFVRIDGGGMIQRIKLLPNDSFRFSVHLPNGELFQTELPEYFNPELPNNLKQISALFALKRVSV